MIRSLRHSKNFVQRSRWQHFRNCSESTKNLSTGRASRSGLDKTAPQIQAKQQGKRILSSTVSASIASTSIKPRGPLASSLEAVVQDPRVRQALPWIGNGAYFVIASGFLMTDMLTLRVALVGGYTGLVAFHRLHPKPLQIPLRWSALFVIVNVAAAATLVMDRYGAPLTEENERLYKENFSQFSRGEFHQLLDLASREEIPEGTVLTREGKVCEYVFFLQTGKARVFHNHRFAAYIDGGGFVNDVAFQQEGQVGAYGTVQTHEPCQALVWKTDELREHLKSRSSMNRNMKYTLSHHLMKSLLQQREVRHSLLADEEPTFFASDNPLMYYTKKET